MITKCFQSNCKLQWAMHELSFLMITKRFQSNCRLQWAMHKLISHDY